MIGGDGFVDPACCVEGFAEGAMGIRVVWVKDKSPANPLRGKIVAADLVRDGAGETQCLGMIWLHGDDPAVERLGFGQASGLMMLESQSESLCNRHIGILVGLIGQV